MKHHLALNMHTVLHHHFISHLYSNHHTSQAHHFTAPPSYRSSQSSHHVNTHHTREYRICQIVSSMYPTLCFSSLNKVYIVQYNCLFAQYDWGCLICIRISQEWKLNEVPLDINLGLNGWSSSPGWCGKQNVCLAQNKLYRRLFWKQSSA